VIWDKQCRRYETPAIAIEKTVAMGGFFVDIISLALISSGTGEASSYSKKLDSYLSHLAGHSHPPIQPYNYTI